MNGFAPRSSRSAVKRDCDNGYVSREIVLRPKKTSLNRRTRPSSSAIPVFSFLCLLNQISGCLDVLSQTVSLSEDGAGSTDKSGCSPAYAFRIGKKYGSWILETSILQGLSRQKGSTDLETTCRPCATRIDVCVIDYCTLFANNPHISIDAPQYKKADPSIDGSAFFTTVRSMSPI